MRQIILDTNFWLLPFEKGLDVFGQIERLSEDEPYTLVATSSVLAELEAMSNSKVKRKNVLAARGALRAIRNWRASGKVSVAQTDGPADGTIITLALQTGAWVATNDRALRMRLHGKRIKVLLLRDEHKIDFF